MSQAQRRHLAVWLMARTLGQAAEKSGHGTGVIEAVRALEPFVGVKGEYNRATARMIIHVQEFLDSKTGNVADEAMDPPTQAAFFHAVNAMASDIYADLPDRPAERKAAWLRLCNANAELARKIFADEGNDYGVEDGCHWAEEIEAIMGRI